MTTVFIYYGYQKTAHLPAKYFVLQPLQQIFGIYAYYSYSWHTFVFMSCSCNITKENSNITVAKEYDNYVKYHNYKWTIF